MCHRVYRYQGPERRAKDVLLLVTCDTRRHCHRDKQQHTGLSGKACRRANPRTTQPLGWRSQLQGCSVAVGGGFASATRKAGLEHRRRDACVLAARRCSAPFCLAGLVVLWRWGVMVVVGCRPWMLGSLHAACAWLLKAVSSLGGDGGNKAACPSRKQIQTSPRGQSTARPDDGGRRMSPPPQLPRADNKSGISPQPRNLPCHPRHARGQLSSGGVKGKFRPYRKVHSCVLAQEKVPEQGVETSACNLR